MNLYLVRHGEAAPVGGIVRNDAERPLTARGERDVVVLAAALARLEVGAAHILSSPLARAVQTARLIASALDGKAEVKLSANLEPGFRPKSLLAECIAHDPASTVIAVGHQPDLGGFLSYLIGEKGPLAVSMPPGAAASVTLRIPPADRDATLRWLLSPDTVERLMQNKRHAP